MELVLAGQHIRLLPEKAAFWQEAGTLLLADMHVGKAGHFRKNGIGLGSGAQQSDLERLAHLIAMHCPSEVVILGDLFHSSANREWEGFMQLIETYPGVKFTLVPGNHDRFFLRHDGLHDLNIVNECEYRGPFTFRHEPVQEVKKGTFNFCGHIHPGVQLKGKGRMRATLPCFWIQPQQVVLPAFGALTGLARINMQAGDKAVAIAGEKCVLFAY